MSCILKNWSRNNQLRPRSIKGQVFQVWVWPGHPLQMRCSLVTETITGPDVSHRTGHSPVPPHQRPHAPPRGHDRQHDRFGQQQLWEVAFYELIFITADRMKVAMPCARALNTEHGISGVLTLVIGNINTGLVNIQWSSCKPWVYTREREN